MDQSSALAVSIAVEGAIVAVLLARLGRAKVSRGIASAAVATLLTHPVAWWSIKALEPFAGYWPAVVLVELIVCLVEAVAYRLLVPLTWPAALGVSLAVNAASTLAGLFYYATFL